MSNELQSARAMVVIELWWRFRVIGAGGDQVGYYCETETEDFAKLDEPAAVKISQWHASGHSDCTFPA